MCGCATALALTATGAIGSDAVPTPSVGTRPTAAVGPAPFRRTTHPEIAWANFESQIDAIERAARGRELPTGEQAVLAGLWLERGALLGRISDYEAAAATGERLVDTAPAEPRSWLVRARAAATFHRFASALADLDEARRRGADPAEVDGVRAGILLAQGRTDEALEIRRRLAAVRPDIVTLGGEAIVRAARGDLDEAERSFAAALASYRDVSPFPVAWIEFQRGLVWMREDDLPRARAFLAAAHARLPQHVQARGHLAEVEAALGNVPRAVELLRPLAETCEDPDYAAQLARILGEAGRADEAKPWRDRAVARYDALMTTHPEAFADHAAELWLGAGADPRRALEYAERNLAFRPTVRAWELVLRAARAMGDDSRACTAAKGARAAGHLYRSARAVVDEVVTHCPGGAG